ncbi:MAG: hypothetical protein EHM70_11815 [Chloroflexota bacterium]|nr:MAG: hypothetical protein EHM70_11815 [Chloroflexota bacterium]
MKYLLSLILAVAVLALPLQTASTSPETQNAIPTISIVSVVTDQSVTIQTNNFPANQTFTARMGAIGTRGVNGTSVGTTDSGQGGSFKVTYNIPASLKGSAQIAIRLESSSGYFAYNWFTNNTSGPVSTPAATPIPGTGGTTGIPTFSISSVTTDQSVTIQTSNFPANQTFTARMGAMGTRGVNGTVVGTTNSGSGGSFKATYNIPAGLKGSAQIAIRLDSPQGYFAYNWFNNSTSGTAPTPAATPIPGTGSTVTPSFSILSVVRDQTVSIRTSNFPANQTFTVLMGAMGTRGVNGTVVTTTGSGSGGSFTATYNVPAGLRGSSQIAIRLESPQGFFAYNWFWNNTAP